MTLLDRGFKRRLDAMSLQDLWDLADTLDVDPERLPDAERSRSDERLAAQVRSAIRVDLRACGRAEAAG